MAEDDADKNEETEAADDEAEDAVDEVEDSESEMTEDESSDDETTETDETGETEASDSEESEDEESSEDVEEVASAMTEGEEDEEETRTQPVVKHEDEFYGTGRRKESVARVWIEAGDGSITVNDQPAEEYFNHRALWIQSLTSPLETLSFQDDIDVWATTEGGGLTGQADALRLGIARALVDMDENARAWLRPEGHLTRDDRQVERKKINQPGARKKQQVSKR